MLIRGVVKLGITRPIDNGGAFPNWCNEVDVCCTCLINKSGFAGVFSDTLQKGAHERGVLFTFPGRYRIIGWLHLMISIAKRCQ